MYVFCFHCVLANSNPPKYERILTSPLVYVGSYPRFDEGRWSDVYVQGLGARLDASPTDHHPHLLDARAAQEWCRLDEIEGIHDFIDV